MSDDDSAESPGRSFLLGIWEADCMKRRSFIRSVATSSLAASFGVRMISSTDAADAIAARSSRRGPFAIDANRVRFFSGAAATKLNVLVIADTHLFIDDARGKPFRRYSKRMASAYHETRHFQTGALTNPEEGFTKALEYARETGVDLIALLGDIFSFPSEAAIEWARGKLAETGLPYFYVAGNHDWHYEGMEGSVEDLRATWTEKRLKPLYQGNDPLMAAYDKEGVRFLAIDNSTYQILPEQLEFFRSHVTSGQPLVLLVHIPLYASGRPVGFGCGHPDWGAKTDRNYRVERRPRWPKSGPTQTTFDFHREAFAANNLLGIFAGHIHQPSIDVVNGIPQCVTDANAKGAFMRIEFLRQTVDLS